MKRWGTITTEETNGRGSAAPYAEMGFSAGDSAVVGHFAVAALSSAPKPHTNNGGGGDTAATATNLHHDRLCQSDAISGELGYTANFIKPAQFFARISPALIAAAAPAAGQKGDQLNMDFSALGGPTWPEHTDGGLPGGTKRARNVTESFDQFQKLEDKLLRLIEVFKRTQTENRALEEQVQALKAGSKDSSRQIESLEKEVAILRREREDVRSRVERLLSQVEALTKTEAAG